jgi:type VI secretion system protein ImpJ
MALLSRVVWQDGMHLAQHHFQAQTRHAESAIHFAVTATRFRPDGLVSLDIDVAALRNGQFVLRTARGTLRDGTHFRMPEGDPLPEPIALGERMDPIADGEIVVLALPRRRHGVDTVGGEAAGARYRPAKRAIPDETTGTDLREVIFGAKTFRLALAHEVLEHEEALPIARVKRDGSGHLVLDERFVPPSVHLGASLRLRTLATSVVELLEAKSESLRRGQGQSAAALRDHAANEIAGFWLLHTVHAALGPVAHLARTPDAHPEALFMELSRVAGALCTFALDAHPRQLPLYDHDALGPAFDALERALRVHLEVVLPTMAVRLPLARTRPTLHTTKLTDDRVFRRARWLLEVRSPLSERDLVARVPTLIKLAPMARIAEVVQQAKSALSLTHLPVPPTAISPRSDAQYFVIAQGGEFWNGVVDSKDIAAYVPDGVPDADLTLCIVLES